jgi:hypothetical protein
LEAHGTTVLAPPAGRVNGGFYNRAFFSLWIHTMNRWTRAAAAALLCLAASLPAAAQALRQIPTDVRPATMEVSATPPVIALDGKPDRLSPGARIRDTNNLQVLSGTLAGATVPVVYRRDAGGQVHEVWILTPDEYAQVAHGPDGEGGLDGFLRMVGMILGKRK